MRCYEESLAQLVGQPVPTFAGADWTAQLQVWLHTVGFRARFLLLDQPAVVSRRLSNGAIHAELMHPTLITTLEALP